MFLAPGGESGDEFRLYDLLQVKKAGQAITQISPDQDVCRGITELRCPGKTRYLCKWNPGAWELCFCLLYFLFYFIFFWNIYQITWKKLMRRIQNEWHQKVNFGVLPMRLQNQDRQLHLGSDRSCVVCVLTVALRFRVEVRSSCSGVWLVSELWRQFLVLALMGGFSLPVS